MYSEVTPFFQFKVLSSNLIFIQKLIQTVVGFNLSTFALILYLAQLFCNMFHWQLDQTPIKSINLETRLTHLQYNSNYISFLSLLSTETFNCKVVFFWLRHRSFNVQNQILRDVALTSNPHIKKNIICVLVVGIGASDKNLQLWTG